MIEFELEGHKFIALNQLLKLLSLVPTGGEANQRIEDGDVTVNDTVEKQKRKKLRAGDIITFDDQEIIIRS